jgi:hypothetical protein
MGNGGAQDGASGPLDVGRNLAPGVVFDADPSFNTLETPVSRFRKAMARWLI